MEWKPNKLIAVLLVAGTLDLVTEFQLNWFTLFVVFTCVFHAYYLASGRHQ